MLGHNQAIYGIPVTVSAPNGLRRRGYSSDFHNGSPQCNYPNCKMTCPYDKEFCILHRCDVKGCDRYLYCSEHFKYRWSVN